MARRRRASRPSPTPEVPARPRAARPPRRAAAFGAGWVLVVIAALAGFWYLAPRRQPTSVLLVTVDTLRADHVGCYGASAAATPVMDALAARGTRFATAIAHVPLTTPSHASILSGLTPLRHGVRDNGAFALPAGVPTLASLLSGAGYRTAAFVSGFPLDHRFGLDRGFDSYDDHLPHGDDPSRAAYVERRADATTDAALRWLSSLDLADGRPFFAWVHYFDPHAPYEPPAAYQARFRGHPYDGEIAFVDAQLGRLLQELDARRLTGRTLVLLTADHGESLGEHGEDTHGVFIYDATLRVPWIMAGPGVPSGRVATTVARGVDVLPTVLDLVGRTAPANIDGRSLRAATSAALPDAPAYVESEFAHLQLGWAPLHGWRTARYKLIDAPRPELYALERDPDETSNRFASERETAARLQRALAQAQQARVPDAARGEDREAAARLRALGYVSAGAPMPARVPGAVRDPKDAIALLGRVERGLAEARSDPALAIRELSAALAEDPSMVLARRYRAIAEAEQKDLPAAISDLQGLERDGVDTGDDQVLLGECLWRAHRGPEALTALDRAIARLPGAPEPLLARARALRSLGRDDEATSTYQRILASAPAQPEALRGLADLALAGGDVERAAELYRRILAADPADVGALVKLGVLAMRSGQSAQAIALLREAVARDPRQPEALLDLGGALARAGRPAEAVPYLERALQVGPRTTVALNGLGFARLESGDRRGALDALRASLALEPRQPRVAAAVSALAVGRMPQAEPR